MGHPYNAPVEGFVTPRPPLPGGSSNDPLIGESLGGWRLLRLLGDDGYGRIYEAQSTGNTAALQVLASMDPKSMDALERSIRAASAVDHPRVAWIRPIQRSGQKDVWFLRERLSGRTLRNVIKEEGRTSAKRLVQLLTDAAEGLAAVHAARLYHGELSPDTFEFDHEGRLKVAGLGISVRTSGEPGTPLMGNPRYVAPRSSRPAPAARPPTSTRSGSSRGSCSRPRSRTRPRPAPSWTSSRSDSSSPSRSRPSRAPAPNCSRRCSSSTRSSGTPTAPSSSAPWAIVDAVSRRPYPLAP